MSAIAKGNRRFVWLAESPAPFSEAQIDTLVEALSDPAKLTPPQWSEIEQIAKKLGSVPFNRSDDVEALETDAARWLRALRLEAAGKKEAAAELLEGIWIGCLGEDRAQRLLAQARNLMGGPQRELAARRLAEVAKVSISPRTLAAVDRLVKQLRKEGNLPFRRRTKIALLGSMTLEFWLPPLRAQCFAWGIDAEFHLGPFGQYQQEILQPRSATELFHPDIVVIACDYRSLGFPQESNDPNGEVQQRVNGLRSLWKQVRERMGAFVVQLNAEIPAQDPYGRLSAALPGGLGRMLRGFNLALWDAERAESAVAVLDVEQIAAKFGKLPIQKQAWHDAVLWNTAKQYPSSQATPVLTHHLTGVFRALLGLSAKCVAVDLDGTLWGGVIGEDGLGGIQIGGGPVGEAHAAFQTYLKALAACGIMLAACSKNNREDALAPFREHRGMVLKEEDFAVFVANWESKDQNLKEIARIVNIGLDAIVFVDDNPMERARVRQNLPEVEVVELPLDPSGFVAALDEPLYFEALALTGEDRVRSQSIRTNQERAQLEAQSGSVDDYLASLEMTVELSPFQPADMARIVQLINKTNQFNLTTRRLNESEVRQLLAGEGNYTQSLRVSDRFGDNGLTGVLIAVRESDALRVHTWLMSCRVMGRRLEEAVLAALGKFARTSGATKIIGEYLPTAKNEVVAKLYLTLGFTATGEPGIFELAAAHAHDAPKFLKIIDHTN